MIHPKKSSMSSSETFCRDVTARPWPKRWGWAPHQQVAGTEVAKSLASKFQHI